MCLIISRSLEPWLIILALFASDSIDVECSWSLCTITFIITLLRRGLGEVLWLNESRYKKPETNFRNQTQHGEKEGVTSISYGCVFSHSRQILLPGNDTVKEWELIYRRSNLQNKGPLMIGLDSLQKVLL